jgi:hypothetical protein
MYAGALLWKRQRGIGDEGLCEAECCVHCRRSCTRGGTSYSRSVRLRRAIQRLLDGPERIQGMMHVSVLDEAELEGHAYRYRPLGSSQQSKRADVVGHSNLP